jgi:hypothetical protein
MTPERWRQIDDLYHAARERAALLERTDPEIRARVERMLALDSGRQILDQSAGDLLADPTKTVIAIKIANSERFQSEAQAISTLNHQKKPAGFDRAGSMYERRDGHLG